MGVLIPLAIERVGVRLQDLLGHVDGQPWRVLDLESDLDLTVLLCTSGRRFAIVFLRGDGVTNVRAVHPARDEAYSEFCEAISAAWPGETWRLENIGG